MEKCQIFAFLKSTFFWYKIDSFYLERHKPLSFRLFCWQKSKNFLMFHEKSWTNPLKKVQNFDFLNRTFLRVKWLDFDLQGHKTLCSGLLCWKTKKGQNFQFFTKNHGLTPLEKCQFSTFLNRCIFSLKWLDFYLQAHKTLCFGLFCWKTKQDHGFLFLTKNHRLTPLKKCQFSTF